MRKYNTKTLELEQSTESLQQAIKLITQHKATENPLTILLNKAISRFGKDKVYDELHRWFWDNYSTALKTNLHTNYHKIHIRKDSWFTNWLKPIFSLSCEKDAETYIKTHPNAEFTLCVVDVRNQNTIENYVVHCITKENEEYRDHTNKRYINSTTFVLPKINLLDAKSDPTKLLVEEKIKLLKTLNCNLLNRLLDCVPHMENVI